MKRLILLSGMFFCHIIWSATPTPHCQTTSAADYQSSWSLAEAEWNNAATIKVGTGAFWGYKYLKLCKLPHQLLIEYTSEDLLPDGKNVIPVDVSPIAIQTAPSPDPNNPTLIPMITSKKITLSDTLTIDEINFSELTFFCLYHNNNIKKDDNNCSEAPDGIFRILTKVQTRSCKVDWLGYKFINKNIQQRFFEKITINANNASNANANIATFSNVELKYSNSNDKIKADVYLIRGKETESPEENPTFPWSSEQVCFVDVYGKFVLKPNDSDIKKTGFYDLNIEWNINPN